MMRYPITAAATAAGLALASPAAAQSLDANNLDRSQVVTSLSKQDAEALVRATSANGTFEYHTDDNGIQRLSFSYESGRNALVRVTACNEQERCFGLSIVAVYNTGHESPAFGRQFANNANATYSIAKVISYDDGTMLIERYVITDGGVTVGHLLDELKLFDNTTLVSFEGLIEDATGN
ncbi:YbjN domain-containing protein [Sphingomicrobium sediminis]|uniref:YbjN domain-containing protein n=1 Tax=Sphingomicrobium sediminis TaxID=2950949 RepID=A0A9X2EHN5_9SPHN|nr:YbjN domain-containing protein [Sphingomicrobium sediminis]MCM8556891.1 YbjN domain-containing protein [Sphingomicrobium sediminis]